MFFSIITKNLNWGILKEGGRVFEGERGACDTSMHTVTCNFSKK